MPLMKQDATSPKSTEEPEFEENLSKYAALLEHSSAKDAKLFLYAELTLLLRNKLAQEWFLKKEAESEVNRLKSTMDRQIDIPVLIKEKQSESGASLEVAKENECLKREVGKVWNAAATIEENLSTKEAELDRKENEIEELKKKLVLVSKISKTKTYRTYNNVERKEVTQFPRANRRKPEHLIALKKTMVRDSKRIMGEGAKFPQIYAQKTTKVEYFQSANQNNFWNQQQLTKTYSERIAALKKMRNVNSTHEPIFICCVHCSRIRRHLARKDRKVNRFRHKCSKTPNKRQSQYLTHKGASCKLDHKGPCCRLATDEEISTYQRSY